MPPNAGALANLHARRLWHSHIYLRLHPCFAETMSLSVPLLRAIKRKGFRLPTPIQRRAMPAILQGMDVIGMARTGSGKTGAFVIPMIEKLKEHSLKAGARAVILSPTRELALQTYKTVRLRQCSMASMHQRMCDGCGFEMFFESLVADCRAAPISTGLCRSAFTHRLPGGFPGPACQRPVFFRCSLGIKYHM